MSEGPNSSGNLQSVDQGFGGVTWSNPSNAASSDDSDTTSALSSSGKTWWLQSTSYGFSIPTGAVVKGVLVEVERSASGAGNVVDNEVGLMIDGASSGDNLADTMTSYPGADAYASYGGATDLWGHLEITPAEVNASDFGFIFAGEETGVASATVSVDHVRMTIYFDLVAENDIPDTIVVSAPPATIVRDAVVTAETSYIDVSIAAAEVRPIIHTTETIVVDAPAADITVAAAIIVTTTDIVVSTGESFITTDSTLSAPTGLVAAVLGRTLIYLSWTDNESTETGYEVWHSTDGWVFTLVDTVGADSVQFFDAELEPGTTYYYLVRAVDSGGPYYSPFAATSATTEGNMDAIFRGDAVAVAEVESSTLTGTWLAGETITVTINGKAVVHTLVSTVIATICTNAAATLNASTVTEFAEITWSATATQIVATSDTSGKSITFTIATDSISGLVGAVATSTGNDGPNALSAENMDSGTLPGASDTMTLENTDIDLLYNLDALSGTLAATYIEASYTGELGLARRNIDGDLYWEYRVRELTVDSSILKIGEGDGDGSGRLQVNLGSVQSAVIVLKTADAAEDGFHALRVRGTHASNTLQATGDCTIDIAAEGDQAAAFATITAGGNAAIRISRRTTVTTLNVFGNAEVDLDQDTALADITAINVGGSATVTIRGDNAITAITVTESGTVDDRGSGTITTLTLGPDANYTTEESTVGAGGRIITNVALTPGSVSFQNGNKAATFTNPVDFGLGGLKDFPNCDFGYSIDVQVS